MALTLFGLFAILILFNIPISVALGLSTIVSLVMFDFPLSMFPQIMYASIGKFTLLAIPFFILAGVIMEYAGISKRLIKFAKVLVGHMKGGLSLVTVIVACFFAAISGSGPATVAALGSILVPAMVSAGYDKGMSSALIASAGGIGIVIPPSIGFVVYGVLAEISIGRLFMAGIIPGILVGLSLVIASLFVLRNNKNLITYEKSTPKEVFFAFKDAFWGILTPIIILGGIYGGFFTPTEAAGVAVVYGLFVGMFIYKEIKIKDLPKLLVESSISSATVLFIVANASVFAWLLTTGQIASQLAASLVNITNNTVGILLIMNVIFLIAGCFIDAISAYYIFVPILLPVVIEMGIDPVVFGVFMTVNLAIGLATPPVGINLYVACNTADISLSNISRKVVPFIIASLIALLLITFIPQLSLWLPNFLGIS